jgi:heparin/heparan-sulfate lyase
VDVLLPAAENANLEKIGGPGRDFWVFGKNYTNDLPAGAAERTSKEPGAWRLELTPKARAEEDLFLTVMQTTNRTSPQHWPVQRLDSADRVGCVISGAGVRWAVSLRKDNTRSAVSVVLAVPGDGQSRILVSDLATGSWEAKRAGSADVRRIRVDAASGAGWFEGATGTWTLTRVTAD